jgi:Tol biopolymer transport system component
VAPNGTVAYIAEELPALVFVDRNGASHPALDVRHNYHGPRFSPDGQRVSFDFTAADGRDVWLFSIADRSLSRATFAHDGHDATWTPDGQFITYLSARSGTETIYKKRAAEMGGDEKLFASPSLGFTGVWLHDGSGLVTTANLQAGSGADIAIIRNAGRGPLEPLAASEFAEAFPAVSPDGRWVAFTSDQSGRPEVYVRLTSGASEQFRISQDGGTEPVWGPGGREVFYRTLSDTAPQLIAATIRTQPSVAVVSRHALFSVADAIGTNPHANYDIAPNGRTFVMVRRTPANRIVVIQNLAAFVRQQSREGSR